MINPYLNPFGNPWDPQPITAEQKPTGDWRVNIPPLPPEDESTLLSRLGHNVMGGVGYVGGLLDKFTGGRAVRGLLGGHPRELLSVLPGSDTFGLTDKEHDEVRGTDLLKNAGMATDEPSWWNTLAGLGTEIALSPATYITGLGSSALTPAGRAAQKIGVLPTTTRARIQGLTSLTPEGQAAAARVGMNPAGILNQPLGGVMNIGLPFTHGTSIGTGAGGERVLDLLGGAWGGLKTAVGQTVGRVPLPASWGGNLGTAAENLAGKVGTGLAGIFDPAAGGQMTALSQGAARDYTKGLTTAAEGIRADEAGLIRRMADLGVLPDSALARRVAEKRQFYLTQGTPQEQEIARIMQEGVDQSSKQSARLAALGLPQGNFAEAGGTEYFPRFSSPTGPSDYEGPLAGNLLNQAPRQLSKRKDPYRDVPGGVDRTGYPIQGGAEMVNELSTIGSISGFKNRLPPDAQPKFATVRDEILKHFEMTGAQRTTADALRAELVAGTRDLSSLSLDEIDGISRLNKAEQLARELPNLPREYADQGVGLFGNNPLVDLHTSRIAKAQSEQAALAMQKLLGQQMVHKSVAEAGDIQLTDALRKAGFTDLAQATQATMAHNLALAHINPADIYVPKDSIEKGSRFLEGFKNPKSLQPLLQAADWMTNLTKSYQTSLFPAFHVRNLFSGLWQNMVMGVFNNPVQGAQSYKDAWDLIRGSAGAAGGVVKGAADIPAIRAMGIAAGDDVAATKALADLAYTHRVTGRASDVSRELTGLSGVDRATAQAQSLQQAIPGMLPYNPLEAKGASGLAGANPLDVENFVPLATGRNIGTGIEDMNRISAFIKKLRDGYDPAVAGGEIRAAHVDYSSLSPVERQLFRRVIPFYSYTRQTMPWTLQKMIEQPGGLTGVGARVVSGLREQPDTFVPSYLGGGLALPLGQTEDKRTRYLTQTDLPFESAFQPLKASIAGTGMNIMGQVNPLIKGPLEYMAGKQFYTGRDIGDLQSMTGAGPLADEILMNSPLSRLASTTHTLMDPRKYEPLFGIPGLPLLANLGSGLRISDIDVEKQKEIEARELIKEYLQGSRNVKKYEAIYPRADQVQNLTQEETELLRLNKNLEIRAKARQDAEKAQRIGVYGGASQ